MSELSFRLGWLGIGMMSHDDFLGASVGRFHYEGHKAWYVALLWNTVVFVDLRSAR